MMGDRLLWWLSVDDVASWAQGNGYRMARLDGWLIANGMPPGSELVSGSVGCVVDVFGRRYLLARCLAKPGRPVRSRYRTAPPAGLPRSHP